MSVSVNLQKITPGDVHAKVIAASPSSSGTQAEAVKFHDDKSLYTGDSRSCAYRQGYCKQHEWYEARSA